MNGEMTGQIVWGLGFVALLGIGAWILFKDWDEARMEEVHSLPTIDEYNRSVGDFYIDDDFEEEDE